MIEVNAILFSVLLNVTALLGFLLLVWVLFAFRSKRNNRQQAGELANAFRADRDKRVTANRQLLNNLGAFHEQALENELLALEKIEARFFEHWLTAYVRRDPEQLQEAYSSLAELLERLRRQQFAAGETQIAAGGDDSAAVQALESRLADKEAANLKLQMDNDKLQRDLNQSKHDIEAMMEEYSAMFEGGTHEEERRERKKDSAKHRIEEVDESGDTDVDAEIEAALAEGRAQAAGDELVDPADVDDEFERALREAAKDKD